MELFWKALAAVLIALIMGQAVKEKDLSLVLIMMVCVMVGLILISYLEPILDFLRTLQEMGDLQGSMLKILLKALGIGIVSQIAQMVCRDSGNTSLGQAVQLLGTAAILWLSLPAFEMLIRMVQRILGEL